MRFFLTVFQQADFDSKERPSFFQVTLKKWACKKYEKYIRQKEQKEIHQNNTDNVPYLDDGAVSFIQLRGLLYNP